MWPVAVALALQVSTPAWVVTDITDNNSGKREVSAVQMSQNADYPAKEAGLILDCTHGKPQLSIRWPEQVGTEYVLISVKRTAPQSAYDIMPPTPWRVNQYSEGKFAFLEGASVDKLAKASEGATLLILVIYGQKAKEEVLFPADGFAAAFDRVTANCKAP